MARPEKPIDWDLVDQLLLYQNTGGQIAAKFGIHEETFYRRFKDKYNENFSGYAGLKYSEGKSNLLSKQFEKAFEGNTQLLLKLGEIYLEQNQIEEIDYKVEVTHIYATSDGSP